MMDNLLIAPRPRDTSPSTTSSCSLPSFLPSFRPLSLSLCISLSVVLFLLFLPAIIQERREKGKKMKEKEGERPGDRLLTVQSLLEKWNDAGQSRRIVAIWEFYPFNKERREKWRRDHRNVASKQILLITLILRATFVACIDAAQIEKYCYEI